MTVSQARPFRAILDRLRHPPDNIVVRARHMVERHVPKERQGPGWDRHWRELEAYLDHPGNWTISKDDNGDDT